MVVRKILEQSLPVGQTSVTFTDSDIPNSLIRVYSNDSNLFPIDRTLSGNTLTINYEVQDSIKYIALEIVKQGLDIIDNVTSTDTDAALSANQGKVLKDLIDGLIPIRNLTELDDVLVTDLTDGDILKYDAEDEMWENYNLPDIPVYLGDLGDVVLENVSTGQVLTYTGAYWTNVNPSAGNDYSTNEVAVGTWIDGKTLYQKTIITERTNIAGNSSISIDDVLSPLNIDQVVSYKNLLSYSIGTSTGEYMSDDLARFRKADSNYSIFLTIGNATLATLKIVWTIQYTKSTI